MSTAVTIFDNPKLAVPTHIANFFQEESNIQERATVPSLSYEGKVWAISMNGEKTRLTRRNDEGDDEPLQTMKVIILDYAKRRGRAYYEGAYDPAKPGTPICWSDNGETPDAGVPTPQGKTCKTCPMSVKGSRVTDQGKAIAACSQHRMLAVIPAHKLDFTPLRCKIAITSDYDKQSPELEQKGWYAFQQYVDLLRSRGVTHTAALVTKLKFDPRTAYPKLIFSPERWLTQEEIDQIIPVTKSEAVAQLLAGTYTPAGVDGVKIDDDDDVLFESPPAAPAPAPQAEAKKSGRPRATPKPEPVAPPAPLAGLDDDDDTLVVATVAPQTPPKVSAKTDVPDDVADLLAEWGD